jgi:hypothetical protein
VTDGIWIALIAAIAAVGGPMLTAIVNHRLGKQDRGLASKTVEMKNRELRALKARNRRLTVENRTLRLRRARRRRNP